MPRPPHPRLFGWRTVVVCVVVGVVVNVGVAWGLAAWYQASDISPWGATLEYLDTEAGRYWVGAGWSRETMAPTLIWPRDGFHHPTSSPAARIKHRARPGVTHIVSIGDGDRADYRVVAMRCGLPMKNLTGFAEARRGPPRLDHERVLGD